MTTKTATDTQAVIYGMLTENTGQHFLDSGGSEGRAWQRNAKKTLEDFQNEPEAWLDPEWPDITKSTFWHLVNHLSHEPDLTAAYHEFANAYPDESWLEITELWLDKLGIKEEGEFYSDARWGFNTYNFDGWLLSQTLQGSTFGMGGSQYLILQVHGGADIRGGYTRPQVFSLKYEGKEGFVFNAEYADFSCNNLECGNRLSARGYSELELCDEYGHTLERFTNLEEVKTCPCGGSWIN